MSPHQTINTSHKCSVCTVTSGGRTQCTLRGSSVAANCPPCLQHQSTACISSCCTCNKPVPMMCSPLQQPVRHQLCHVLLGTNRALRPAHPTSAHHPFACSHSPHTPWPWKQQQTHNTEVWRGAMNIRKQKQNTDKYSTRCNNNGDGYSKACVMQPCSTSYGCPSPVLFINSQQPPFQAHDTLQTKPVQEHKSSSPTHGRNCQIPATKTLADQHIRTVI